MISTADTLREQNRNAFVWEEVRADGPLTSAERPDEARITTFAELAIAGDIGQEIYQRQEPSSDNTLATIKSRFAKKHLQMLKSARLNSLKLIGRERL